MLFRCNLNCIGTEVLFLLQFLTSSHWISACHLQRIASGVGGPYVSSLHRSLILSSVHLRSASGRWSWLMNMGYLQNCYHLFAYGKVMAVRVSGLAYCCVWRHWPRLSPPPSRNFWEQSPTFHWDVVLELMVEATGMGAFTSVKYDWHEFLHQRLLEAAAFVRNSRSVMNPVVPTARMLIVR